MSRHIESEKIAFEEYRNDLDHNNNESHVVKFLISWLRMTSKFQEDMLQYNAYDRAYSSEFQTLVSEYILDD